jgi:hypothetical protein
MSAEESHAGVIVLRQQAYMPIDIPETLAALPEPLRQGPRKEVLLDLTEATERAVAARDWHEAAAIVLAAYRVDIKPLLSGLSNHTVAYFGTVPISLAVQLGYLVGTWRTARTFLHHHQSKSWKWAEPTSDPPQARVNVAGVPRDGSLSDGDLVVRLSTSHIVDRALTTEVLSRPLAEVDISTDPIGEDVLSTPEVLEAVADEFKKTIDQLHDLFPNATTLHLFAAVPVGLAFRVGMRVSPTIHPPVQLYEFDANWDPRYYPSLPLQVEPVAAIVVDEADRVAAVGERRRWAEELARLQAFAAESPAAQPGGWLSDVLPADTADAFFGSWRDLPRLRDVPAICSGGIDVNTTEAPGGFLYRSNDRRWVLGDALLVPIMRRIKDETARRRAARLFLLHEGLHTRQALTGATSPEVGRFPKVLEEIDYQADVWAQLHERGLEARPDAAALKNEADFCRTLMGLAVETMFSFDDSPLALTVMQIRRVARYLIWSWQSLRAERCSPDDKNVWALLAEKPIIELAGPDIRTRDRRVWYLLDAGHVHAPEVAIYHRNRLYRSAAGPASPIHEILEGLRSRESDRIRNGLRGICDQVLP